ncbi:MAG: IS630 family transposase [Leptolyngbyaceae cyanobacterium RM2_2_4]|nr:IS630 family transposase [Leptolyngbyaceae cyanobacterium RM2_2_4]
MSRYSLGIRQKVVTAYHLSNISIRKLAQQFMMSPVTVQKYLNQDRDTQDLTPLKPGPTKPGKLFPHRDFIVQMVADHPDWTLRQYCDYLLEHLEIYSSIGGMCQFLQKEKLTPKKKTYRGEKVATEEGQQQRLDYWDRMRDVPVDKLVFIDETGFWVGMSRDVARSLSGKKALCLRQFYKGRKMTLIGAIKKEGVVATRLIKGWMKGKDFRAFLEIDLIPKLKGGEVIVMDNLSSHKMEGIKELVEEKGARIEYLPPYSPDFNPIEMMWSVIKAFVRLYCTRGMAALEKLVEIGLYLIETSSFSNWFAKCCYCDS